MTRVRVSTTIAASPSRVWDHIKDLASHVDWMNDAVAIRYLSHQRTGVGTRFETDTRVGPLRLTDKMEVTDWDDGRTIAIRHTGMVTGTGRFIVRRRLRGGTRFTWEERLKFPWWMGGPFGSFAGGLVLRVIWRRNLHNLKERIEASRRSRASLRPEP